MDINEQILSLKLITKKLESAHDGHDVEWPTTSNRKFLSLKPISLFGHEIISQKTLLHVLKTCVLHFGDGYSIGTVIAKLSARSSLQSNAFLKFIG